MSDKSTLNKWTFPVRLANLFFLLVFVSLLLGTARYYYHPAPPIDYPNGVYESPGPTDVIIKNGEVQMGKDRSRMKFGFIKNALVGSLDKPLGPLFHMEEGRKVPVDLFFDGNRQFSTTDESWNKVVYRRVITAQPG